LRLTAAQQRTTGQNLPSDLYATYSFVGPLLGIATGGLAKKPIEVDVLTALIAAQLFN
jgi:hypothetical protein